MVKQVRLEPCLKIDRQYLFIITLRLLLQSTAATVLNTGHFIVIIEYESAQS